MGFCIGFVTGLIVGNEKVRALAYAALARGKVYAKRQGWIK